MTEPVPTFVGRVLSATDAFKQNPVRLLLIVRRPYAHIEDHLRSAFEGREDVVIIRDRRRRVRRMMTGSFPGERRRADRRLLKEDVLEVVIEGYRPDSDAASAR